jgi:hypothetical protein
MDTNRLSLSGEARTKGLYIAGNTGSGKSSLIADMALEDIRNGRGVCVIDPTGDLVTRLLNWVPRERVHDTIIFDSAEPVPIDFFSYKNWNEREVLTGYLLDIFDLSNAPIARPRLMKIIGTLFDANDSKNIPDAKKATFLDISDFITSKKRRDELLFYAPTWRTENWDDPSVFNKLESITERMIPFFENPRLSKMLGTTSPKLKIADVVEQGAVLLVNLRDSPTGNFIGALISSKFQQAIWARRDDDIPESERVPYYLYVDECNTVMKYAPADFDAILLRARKYKLCLIIGNQLPHKLPTVIKESLGTIQSLVLFNLSTNDSRIFKDRIFPYTPDYLVNLPQYRAVARTENKVYEITTPPFLGFSPASYAEEIQKRTVEKYGCDTPPNSFNKGNGNSNPADTKTDKIEASGAPNVPPHGDQTKGPHKPR